MDCWRPMVGAQDTADACVNKLRAFCGLGMRRGPSPGSDADIGGGEDRGKQLAVGGGPWAFEVARRREGGCWRWRWRRLGSVGEGGVRWDLTAVSAEEEDDEEWSNEMGLNGRFGRDV